MEVGCLDPRRLVFVEERWAPTPPWLPSTLTRPHRPERAFSEVPRNRAKNTPRCLREHETTEGMGPSMAVEGATTSRVFETYLEQVLAPTLRPAQVVVMDNNLGAHWPKRRIRELIEGRGAASSSTCLPTRRTSTR
jgi:hypothetical protein